MTGHSRHSANAFASTFAIGGISCSKDSFVVNQSFVLRINICGKSPALRVAAKRYMKYVLFLFTQI